MSNQRGFRLGYFAMVILIGPNQRPFAPKYSQRSEKELFLYKTTTTIIHKMKLQITIFAILATCIHGLQYGIDTNLLLASEEAESTACIGLERRLLATLKRKLMRSARKAIRKSRIQGVLYTDWTEASTSEENSEDSNGGRRLLRSRKLGKSLGTCVRGCNGNMLCMWLCKGRRRLQVKVPKDQDHRELESTICGAIQDETPMEVLNLVALVRSKLARFSEAMKEKFEECASALEKAVIEVECSVVCEDC